jgi:hypothetical protein
MERHWTHWAPTHLIVDTETGEVTDEVMSRRGTLYTEDTWNHGGRAWSNADYAEFGYEIVKLEGPAVALWGNP